MTNLSLNSFLLNRILKKFGILEIDSLNKHLNIIEMKKNKCLAIWMDHSNAFLMELTNDLIVTNTIVSESLNQKEEYSQDKHEKLIHKKEQHQQLNYYKKLGDSIRNYQEGLLFGPTDAQKELLNLLK